MNKPSTACPTCYRRLPAPGIAAHGHPIAVPQPGDLTVRTCRGDDQRITIEFASGLVASRPTAVSQRLAGATQAQRDACVIDEGYLHWDEIDEDIDAAQFLGIPEDLAAVGLGADIRPYPRRRLS